MDTCVIANQFCKQETKTVCFACGLPVCVNCSKRTKYYFYGRVRLCDSCRDEYKNPLMMTLDERRELIAHVEGW